jgi:hypothetical protein
VTTEPASLPTWCAEGKQAVVLANGFETGMGSYSCMYRVVIVRITRTQVKVQGSAFRNGATTVFRRDTLRESGTHSSATCDTPVLVDPQGLEARSARREISTHNTLLKVVASIQATVDLMRIATARSRVAKDVVGTIEHTIINLDELIKDAINARNTLVDLRES